MVCYSPDPENPTKSYKSRGSNLPVYFKNIQKTAQAIKGMHIWKTTMNVMGVTSKAQCVPFQCCNTRVGRRARAKQWGWTQGRGSKESAEF